MLSQIIASIVSVVSPEILLKLLYTFIALATYALISIHLEEAKHNVSPPAGFKKLGRKGRSNLADEYGSSSQGLEQGTGKDGTPNWKVKALYIFPVKSCAPLEVDEADVCPTGLLWDREFSFAELLVPETKADATEEEKKPSWRFRTQRTPGYENLALVTTDLWFPPDRIGASPSEKVGAVMIIRYPHVYRGQFKSIQTFLQQIYLIPKYRSFSVPLDPPKSDEFPYKDVIIWKDKPNWYDYSRYVAPDFPSFVTSTSNPFALFRADPSRYREVMRCAPPKEEIGYQSVIGFQDAYPLHLLNLPSVRDVAEKVKVHLPIFSARRFRANIITAGPKAYDEDDWKQIVIGEDQKYYCVCHTVRCKLPNVDPDTAVRDRFEPDRTLKEFRRIDAGDPKNACLGMQAVPAAPHGKIRVGDGIRVLERGEHLYIPQ